MRHRPGMYMAQLFPYLDAGYERHPFSIEMWFSPAAVNNTIPLATHSGDNDGISWIGGAMYFSLHFTTLGYVRLEYRPPTMRSMHVVGVYNGEKMELWVNGECVDSLTLTDAQKDDTYIAQGLPGYLVSGNADGIQQAWATYDLALSPLQIRNHYNAGKMTVGLQAASGMFSGIREKINNETADIFLDRSFDTAAEWGQGFGTAIIGDSIKSPVDDTGAYAVGAWDVGIPLDQGGSSIEYMSMRWEATGVVVVYTSLDGTTWSVQGNAGRIAGITSGFNPTGKTLRVRVTFAGGSRGEVHSLDIHGYKSMNVTPATRPITLNSNAQFFDEANIMDYDVNTGLYSGGGTITIGATADAQEYRTLSVWYYGLTGTVSVDVTPTTFYENNVARSVRTRLYEWTHVVYVFPAKTDAITLSGTAVYMAPTLFADALTADQVDKLYKSYTGIPKQGVDSGNIGSIHTPSVTMYANDWSIASAG